MKTYRQLMSWLPKNATCGKSLPDLGEVVEVRDLGCLKLQDNQFRVFYYRWIWGKSERCTSRLFFFKESGEYIGQYSHFDVPILGVAPNTLIVNTGTEDQVKACSSPIPGSFPPAELQIGCGPRDQELCHLYR